jgi:hypothetical protein
MSNPNPNQPAPNAPRIRENSNPLSALGKVPIGAAIGVLNQAANKPVNAPIDVGSAIAAQATLHLRK